MIKSYGTEKYHGYILILKILFLKIHYNLLLVLIDKSNIKFNYKFQTKLLIIFYPNKIILSIKLFNLTIFSIYKIIAHLLFKLFYKTIIIIINNSYCLFHYFNICHISFITHIIKCGCFFKNL